MGSRIPAAPSERKRRIDRFVHHPGTELGLVVLILASVALIVIAAILPDGHAAKDPLNLASDVITGVFVIELGIRFWLAPRKRRFFARYAVDILAVAPLLRPLRFLRILMLLRIFRAGALFNRRLLVFRGALRATLQELTLLGTATAALMLMGAVVLHYAEGRANTGLDGMGDILWFTVASTIGAEPIGAAPTTMWGRAATLALMVGGLTLFGLFIGTVSASMMARLSSTMESGAMELDELTEHTVVFGWNRAGPTVLQELFSGRTEKAIVVVTETDVLHPEIPTEGVRGELLYQLKGDYTRIEVLEQANIRQAASVILLADELIQRSDQDRDARTVLAALTIEKIAPEIFTVAELTNRQNEALLRMAGVEEIVVAEEYGAVVMGAAERNRGLVAVVDEILTGRYGSSFCKVEVGARSVGRTIGELHDALKREQSAILVAWIHCEDGVEQEVTVNPPVDAEVTLGDRLVVLSEKAPSV